MPNPPRLTEQLMVRVEPELRARLEAHRERLAGRNLRLSVAAVARLALAEGLDALERTEGGS